MMSAKLQDGMLEKIVMSFGEKLTAFMPREAWKCYYKMWLNEVGKKEEPPVYRANTGSNYLK